MEINGRNSLNEITRGAESTLEELRKQTESRKEYYKKTDTLTKLKEENPRIFNAWRSIMYSNKGKKAGCDTEEWRDFRNFYKDVFSSYVEGYVFHRIDTTKPFSKDNFIWISPKQASELNHTNTIYLTYKGETLSLREAAIKYNQPLNAIKLRYHRHRDSYTIEEIIFGKRICRHSKTPKNAKQNSQEERIKASKMISSYKIKDKKRGVPLCDIDTNWMISNIMHQPCVYCGDTERVGCDRIDNNLGHTKDNVVPCCYECNVARGDNFSFQEMKVLGQTIRKIKQDRNKNNQING